MRSSSRRFRRRSSPSRPANREARKPSVLREPRGFGKSLPLPSCRSAPPTPTPHSSPILRTPPGHQGDIVLLFPVLTGKIDELGEEEIDQRRFARAVSSYQPLQPREAEHLVVRVVRLNQPVAVKEDALAPI